MWDGAARVGGWQMVGERGSGFHFVGAAGDGEIDDVDPGEKAGDHGQDDRPVALPGADDGDGGAEADSGLGDVVDGFAGGEEHGIRQEVRDERQESWETESEERRAWEDETQES